MTVSKREREKNRTFHFEHAVKLLGEKEKRKPINLLTQNMFSNEYNNECSNEDVIEAFRNILPLFENILMKFS